LTTDFDDICNYSGVGVTSTYLEFYQDWHMAEIISLGKHQFWSWIVWYHRLMPSII